VVPAVVVRDPRSSAHRLVLGPPIAVPRSADRSADLRVIRAYASWLSGWARRYPCHVAAHQLGGG
jgi:hypothetical protein